MKASARQPSPATRWIAILALGWACSFAVARLISGAHGAHVLAPIGATVTVALVVRALGARALTSTPMTPLGFATGSAAAALTSLWVSMASATTWGLPTASTLRTLSHQLGNARHLIVSRPTPLPATEGVVFIASLGTAIVAVAAASLDQFAISRSRVLWRAPLPALFPCFFLFLYTSLVSPPGEQRLAVTVFFLLASLAYVTSSDHSYRRRAVVSPGSARPSKLPRLSWSSLASAVASIGLLAAAGPALSAMRLTVLQIHTQPGGGPQTSTVPNWSKQWWSGKRPAGPKPITAIDLVSHIAATLQQFSDVPAFLGTTPNPTYWQMATLTSFDGSTWSSPALPGSSNAVYTPGAASIPVLPEPQATGTFPGHVFVEDLSTRMLPVPPSTLAVSGMPNDRDLPGVGFASARVTSVSSAYDLTAATPRLISPQATGAPDSPFDPGSVSSAALGYYTMLPPEPTVVADLAHLVVKGATTRYSQAVDIMDWLRSPQFHYTLSPPKTRGSNALVDFLTRTKAGYCQQFAGAFAVLAREVGLPTRLAVGFSTGTSYGNGQYLVQGADAHIWPEVYFGDTIGWVSFEPTPSSPLAVGVVNPQIQAGPALSAAQLKALAALAASSPTTATTLAALVPTTTASTLPAPSTPSRSATTRPLPWLPSWLPALVAGICLLLLARGIAVGVGRRANGPFSPKRRRARHIRSTKFPGLAASNEEVVRNWLRCTRELRVPDLDLGESETPLEHARRVSERFPAAARPFEELATLATFALYGPGSQSADEAERANRLRFEVTSALQSTAHARKG